MRLTIHALMLSAVLACGPGPDGGNGTGGDDGGGGGGVDAPVNTGADAAPITDATPKPDGIEGCNPENFTLQQAPPPEVMLVIDRSGSMLEQGSTAGVTKWDELEAAVDFVANQFDASIHFGLLMYPTGGECSTSGPQVGVGANNAGAVLYYISGANPAGGTPTAAALVNAASSMTSLGDPMSPKFIILATDGGPNCNYFLDSQPSCSCTYASSPEYCCTAYPDTCIFGNTCLDDSGTLSVMDDLHANDGIDTFVIGLEGTAEYVDLLNAMAMSGGRPQAGSTSYYPASSQAQLQSALQAIASSVISCTIDLGQAPQVPNDVRIWIDGREVSRDPTNGWNYSDPSNTQIDLSGAACDTLRDGTEHVVTATFGCVVN